ncbi:MAG: ABC transporter permease, partial [Mailhella sp.]|nr:ABC transporter permease [Mailhella sp.]
MDKSRYCQRSITQLRYSALVFLLYCSKKLLWILLVFLGITLISFFVMHLAPGSPTDMQTSLNPLVNEAYREKLNALYGLDKPILIQYYDWLSRLIQFDFGNSLSGNGRPVLDTILERLPLTVGLNVTSLLLALFLAFPIGIMSAVHQGKFIDKFFTFLVFLGFAMPGFWLALLLMLYLGIEHNLVPLSGITSLNFDTLSFTQQCLDVMHHLFLPVLVSTVGALAGTSRFLRSSMLEVLRQDYILTAKAKGLTNN